MVLLIAAVALLGLAIGSFLNVVIYRVPNGLSVVTPSSHCPRCEQPISARHNVPLLGWLALRGRCARCAAPISPRYPLVELATGLAFVAVTLILLHRDSAALVPAWLYFTAIAIALAAIDLDCNRLPNAIVLPSYPVLVVLLAAAAIWQGDRAALLRSGVGALVLFAGYLAIALAYPRGMGMGDVKLAGLIGAMLGYLGFPTLLVGAFGAFLLGGVAGSAIIVSRRGNRTTPIPFGPFMLGASILALCFAQPIVTSYRQFSGV